MEKEYIDLYEFQSRLKRGIDSLFPSRFWLKAEISAIKARTGGHCYLELSQSGESGVVAKAQAVIWSSRYRFVAPYFESVTGSPLQEGMSVLVQVQVNFSQLYGLSLVINDIDPDFSLGESERQRRLTLERLREEGLMDMQRDLACSALPYRIAVISAEDAAGYRDFMRHLHENEYGFVFETDLFPALMQGTDCPASIIAALDAVLDSGCRYDMVAVLRGGGARLDLACFDDYDLSSHIAQFPLPVFTAIGHDQDVHVCDMVAYVSVKTPTALADELVGMYVAEDARLGHYAGRLRMALSGKLHKADSVIESLSVRFKAAFRLKMAAMDSRLTVLESRIHACDPEMLLRKGYVLAVDTEGKVIREVTEIKAGDKVGMLFHDGRMDCTVDVVSVRQNRDIEE